MKHLIIVTALTVFLLACNSNPKSEYIEIKGTILDGETGKPVPNARVTLLCWRQVGFDEETYDKIDTNANDIGVFEAQFQEGFKVDIGSVAPNYHPSVLTIKNVNDATNIELRLESNTSIGSLQQLGELTLFIRDYDTKPTKPRTYHGIDLLHNIDTQVSDSMDLGIMRDAEVQHSKILITNAKGGIVPIFDETKNISEAPQDGYVTEYELKGVEKGFFIRCRDGKTYARLMVFSLKYDRSSPYSNGSVKDYGIVFNAELQTSGREFNSLSDLRLEYYILDHL